MRLFFALWPDAPAARQLESLGRDVAERAEGRPVPVGKIHLTLAFLGEVLAESLDPAIAAGAAARSPPFELAFDTLGWFRGARVAWTGCSRPPAALMALQSSLEAALRIRGFSFEDRPFVPHITLARQVGRAVARSQVVPIAWEARELCLVRSETGTGRYVTTGRWALE